MIVTPEKTVLDTQANFVTLPLYDGEIGIAPLHSAMIGRLGYGELRIRTNEYTRRYYVDGGFVQVADDEVSVLTNRALPASDVYEEDAREQLRVAQSRKVAGEEEIAIRDRQIQQARAQIRVASRAE